MNLYWSAYEPIVVARVTYIGRSSDLYRLTHPSRGEVGARTVKRELQRYLFPPVPWAREVVVGGDSSYVLRDKAL